ncbi:hypothetical protein RB594_009479 [Gaeumannomyces avenae]
MQASQGQAPDQSLAPARKKSERSTTSCGECRRRKQKCNQGQPCSNCKRRFPEPICDYGPRRGDAPAFVAVLAPPIARQQHNSDSSSSSRTARALNLTTTTTAGTVATRWQVERLPGPNHGGGGGGGHWGPGVDLVTGEPTYHPKPGHGGAARSAGKTAAARGQKASSSPGLAFGFDGIVYQCQLSGPVQSIGHLPIAPTKENAMLICTFPELLYRFKGSFDGEPDPDNPFITTYVPWCIQSPLLARTSLYISARSLAERGFIDPSSTMRAKGEAISALNEHLRSEQHWIGDEVMAGVVQFVSIEWFFGEPEVVRAHLLGLREMVRLRGGFPSRGVGALVTKVALVDDLAIAWWLEDEPTMGRGQPDGFDHEYVEPPREHFKVRYGSPLARLGGSGGGGGGAPTFASCEEALGLHPATASILDDVRFLIGLALALPVDPTPDQERKVRSTAAWIYGRISRLNSESPGGPMSSTEEDSDAHETDGNDVAIIIGGDSAGVESPGTRSKGSTLSPEAASSARPHSLLPDYPSYTSSSRVTTPSADMEFESPPAVGDNGSRPTKSPVASPYPEYRARPQQQQQQQGMASASAAPGPGADGGGGGQSGRGDGDWDGQGEGERGQSSVTDCCIGQEPPDPLYTGVRLAALLYARALAERRPFSEICPPSEALALLMATWRIPLGRWRGIIGVFLFMLMAIMPTVREIQYPGSRSRLARAREKGKRRQQQQHGNRDDATAAEDGGSGSQIKADGGIACTGAPSLDWDDPNEVVSMAHVKPHSGFVKSIVQIGFMQMAIEDWGLCADTLGRGLALQRWLRGGDGGG